VYHSYVSQKKEEEKMGIMIAKQKKTNIYFTLPLCSPRVTENSRPTRLAHWSVRGHVVSF
jgi:hypothetical protein